jgi:hypothetical protein
MIIVVFTGAARAKTGKVETNRNATGQQQYTAKNSRKGGKVQEL